MRWSSAARDEESGMPEEKWRKGKNARGREPGIRVMAAGICALVIMWYLNSWWEERFLPGQYRKKAHTVFREEGAGIEASTHVHQYHHRELILVDEHHIGSLRKDSGDWHEWSWPIGRYACVVEAAARAALLQKSSRVVLYSASLPTDANLLSRYFTWADSADTGNFLERITIVHPSPSLFEDTPLIPLAKKARWKKLPLPVMSIALRLQHLWRHGGISLGSDSILLRDDIFSTLPDVSLSWNDERRTMLGAAAFSFPPRHEFVWSAMEEVIKQVAESDGKNLNSFAEQVLSGAYHAYPIRKEEDAVSILPRSAFHYTHDPAIPNVFNYDFSVSADPDSQSQTSANTNLMSSLMKNEKIFVFPFYDSTTKDKKISLYSMMNYVVEWKCWDAWHTYSFKS